MVAPGDSVAAMVEERDNNVHARNNMRKHASCTDMTDATPKAEKESTQLLTGQHLLVVVSFSSRKKRYLIRQDALWCHRGGGCSLGRGIDGGR